MSGAPLGDGRFTLLGPLGRGGMGEVWRARRGALGDEVAVKVLRGDKAPSPAAVQAFLAEARAVAGLDHPGVVAVFDFGLVSAAEAGPAGLPVDAPWVAMELLTGGSLARRPEQGWSTWRGWLDALLAALAHAHARGVVHRDLKPANVLFDERGRLKVVDFGLVLDLRRAATEAPYVGGTPATMAPEQFSREWRDQGPWTDLYAVGVVGWWLTSGRWPYFAEDIKTWAALHRGGALPEWAPHASVPAEVGDWLRWMLARDPAHRPGSAAEARAALPVERTPELGALVSLSEAPSTWAFSGSLGASSVGLSAPAAPPPMADPGAAPLGGAPGLFRFRDPPLEGRDRLQDLLWEALEAVRGDGRPRAVLLRGPSGVGKTALARWARLRAAELDLAVPFAAAFQPGPGRGAGLAALLDEIWRTAGLDGAALRARLAQQPELRPGHPGDPVGVSPADLAEAALTGLVDEAALLALTRRVITARRRGRPALVHLDDLQRGAAGRALWRSLLDGDTPALLIGTASDEGLDEGLLTELDGLTAHPLARVADVAPLGLPHLEALLRRMLSVEAGLAAQIAARASGNPRFVTELARSWLDAGRLVPGPEGWVLPGGDLEDQLPRDVIALWSDRVAHLLRREPDRISFELAAALGDEVDERAWARACERFGVPVAERALRRMVAASLVELRADGRWRWCHGMLRESVLAGARHGRRLLAVTRAAAEALVGYGLAERTGRAELWMAAGAHLRGLTEALDVLDELIQSGERAAALRLCARAERALEALGGHRDHPLAAVVMRQKARALRMGDEPVGALAVAVAAAGMPSVEPEEHARLVEVQAWCLLDLGRDAEAAAALEGAGPGAAALRALALLRAGRLDEADALLALAPEPTPLHLQLGLLLHLERGEVEAAVAAGEAALPWVDARGADLQAAALRVAMATALRQGGRVDAAAERAREARRRWEDLGSPWLRDALVELAWCARAAGELPRAGRLARRVWDEARGPAGARARAQAGALLALAAAHEGDLDAIDEVLAAPAGGARPSRAAARDLGPAWDEAAARLPPGPRRRGLRARAAAARAVSPAGGAG